MAVFEASNQSEETVPHSRESIWAVLTDPALLARLSPLVNRIDSDGGRIAAEGTHHAHWVWHLAGISALGITIDPSFRERMTFVDGHKIEFAHDPEHHERAGADGRYLLDEVDGGTHLSIDLTIHVELPLPRTAGPAVRRVMHGVMQRTGDRFAHNLLEHLRAHA